MTSAIEAYNHLQNRKTFILIYRRTLSCGIKRARNEKVVETYM